jgi:hypothetical protein
LHGAVLDAYYRQQGWRDDGTVDLARVGMLQWD